MEGEKRKSAFTMRTTKIPDYLYEYIMKRTESENRNFKDYVIELVIRDYYQQLLIGNEIQRLQINIEDVIKKEISGMRDQINDYLFKVRISKSSFDTVASESEKSNLKEQQLLDVKVDAQGSLQSSEYESDF